MGVKWNAWDVLARASGSYNIYYVKRDAAPLPILIPFIYVHFEAILALLDGYAIWLQSGRQADNLVARIGKADTVLLQQIGSRTRDQYLRLLKKYLSWCVTRYIPRARQNSATQAEIDAAL